ncbi:DUF2165 domain-containing protein [Alteromonas aestuariivivens]|uniref:DUF2165 domain-containing protein n=1 Tax=Alteromonas aestuariivivens TaxID=1938339 RepID=A0A3D8MF43_9ALTE|nr:DUF2165 domain-containing protein [Alteromonas aestuariivivens]RDV29246.1 DUF2165 domain-containing protein [Alteromonas aestuariivivens]
MNSFRLIKTSLVASAGVFSLLVAYNNMVDYGSNFAFVQHVLTMDTTFEGNQLTSRAVENPFIHHIFYALIITAEALTGTLCCIGALQLWRYRAAPAQQFVLAKGLASWGLTVGILLWFSGFMTVGAEWFLMWQSSTWNGQQAAFRFIVVLFLTLLFLHQKDSD